MTILTAGLAAALTWAGERLLDSGATAIKQRLRDKAARTELADITARAMEAAVSIAPSLAEDFRSDSFLNGVVAPIAIERLADPSAVIGAPELADQYQAKFVKPWVRDGNTNRTLATIFDTDQPTLLQALEAFVSTLRTELFASEHWKDVGRDRTIEETHQKVSALPDTATSEMLNIALSNRVVLLAALNGRLADALQVLLLHPGFEDVVLAVAEAAADTLVADRNGGGRGVESDFVAIAIALQRTHGAQRARAMNLYERFLDAEVYGANEAAAAALRN